jgi:hypothetical protein
MTVLGLAPEMCDGGRRPKHVSAMGAPQRAGEGLPESAVPLLRPE